MNIFHWIVGGGHLLWEMHLPGIPYRTMLLLLILWGDLRGQFVQCFNEKLFHLAYLALLRYFVCLFARLLYYYINTLRMFCYFCIFKFYSIKLFISLFVLFTYCFNCFFVLYTLFGWLSCMYLCAAASSWLLISGVACLCRMLSSLCLFHEVHIC